MSDKQLPVTHRCIAVYESKFRQVRLWCPGDPYSGATLVEIPMHDGPRPPEILHLRGLQLRAAACGGTLVVIEAGDPCEVASGPLPAALRGPWRVPSPRRPRAALTDAGKAILADLRRRGLIMTGAEYVRSLEARRR